VNEEEMRKMSQLYRTGSFKEVVRFNAVEGLKAKADYQLGIEGRGYQTLALFILGLLIGRTKYFERIEENMPLTRKLFKRSIWVINGSWLLVLLLYWFRLDIWKLILGNWLVLINVYILFQLLFSNGG
jgi:uncharacterized protein